MTPSSVLTQWRTTPRKRVSLSSIFVLRHRLQEPICPRARCHLTSSAWSRATRSPRCPRSVVSSLVVMISYHQRHLLALVIFVSANAKNIASRTSKWMSHRRRGPVFYFEPSSCIASRDSYKNPLQDAHYKNQEIFAFFSCSSAFLVLQTRNHLEGATRYKIQEKGTPHSFSTLLVSFADFERHMRCFEGNFYFLVTPSNDFGVFMTCL